ncbi:hypothetical protein BGLY_4185 [Bacillus glycinifermentans]|nr:hypothetical protein BGLY_4185 [Bacillus glycinifermentans]
MDDFSVASKLKTGEHFFHERIVKIYRAVLLKEAAGFRICFPFQTVGAQLFAVLQTPAFTANGPFYFDKALFTFSAYFFLIMSKEKRTP